jgi:hypothetical protein
MKLARKEGCVNKRKKEKKEKKRKRKKDKIE